MKIYHLGMALLLMTVACQSTKSAEENTTIQDTTTTVLPQLTKIWETDTLMTTSESVIYDAFRDVLYVSNINGIPPTVKDEDGFISILSSSGEILQRHWVTEISAPKGMGIVDSSLFVTNIDEVVEIDIPSGVIVKRYPIAGAEFLNDITTTANGDLYISDSNLSNIHKLSKDSVSLWMSDTTLHNSNGLLFQNNSLLVAAYGADELFRVDMASLTKTTLTTGIPAGDGIVAVGDNYLVSNWNGEVHFVDAKGNRTLLLDTKEAGKNAADIGYMASKNLLLVPTFFGNTVAAYEIK